MAATKARFLAATKTDARLNAPQALWSAAACCRFGPASLLAPHLSKYRAPLHGQQVGLSESGSKLPHSRALRPSCTSKLLTRLDQPFAQHAAEMRQHLQVVVMAGGLVEQDLRRVRELSSS
jgi:hypothetical protein